jgi:hypothetical protein
VTRRTGRGTPALRRRIAHRITLRSFGRWRNEVQVGHLEAEAGDPEHEPGEGRWVGQVDAQGGYSPAYRDLAVVELRAKCFSCLASESDLVG